MAELAVVENGVVINRIVGEPGFMGAITCPTDAGIGWTYDGDVFTAPDIPAPAPDSAAVNDERDRRISGGFMFGGTAFQLGVDSIAKITAMGADARFALLAGAQSGDLRWADPDNDFGWIATDNTVMPLDAQTMAAFADAAKLWVSRHTFAARALKNLSPPPADFATNASYWP